MSSGPNIYTATVKLASAPVLEISTPAVVVYATV